MGKVVENVVARLVPDEARIRWLIRVGQIGSRRGRLVIDAVAIRVSSPHASWRNGHMPGVLLMDINAALPGVANGRPVNLMKVRQMDGDLIRWMESFPLESTVEMIIKGNAMQGHRVEPRVLQGSRVSMIFIAFST
jgi:hypothetical protein